MFKRALLTVAALMSSIIIASAQTPLTVEDFVAKAASSGKFEVQSSRIALATSSDVVKAFAQQMITDHKAINKGLKAAAAADKVPVPKAMDEKDSAALASLKGKRGEDLDRLYIDAQVKAHDEAVALFSTYAQSGDKPMLKAFAVETLPALKKHQEKAKQLASGKSS